MIQQPLFEKGRAHQIEPVAAKVHNRRLQLDPPPAVQHMRQRYAPILHRQLVGAQGLQQRPCARPLDQHLGKGRNVHDPDPLSHCAALITHDVMHLRAPERILIDGLHALGREPARAFVAKDLFEHRALVFQPLVQRRWLHRPPREPVEMRKRDLVPQAVILARLHHLPFLGGIGTKAARVVLAHRDIGAAVHHPPRQLPRQAWPPADPDLRPATAPVIAHTRRGTDQRVAIGRVADRAVHLSRDAQIGKDRHPVQALFQPRHHPVVIGVKELVLRLPRAMILPDGVGIFLLVNPDQPAFLLHPDIARDLFVIPDHRQLSLQILELRHVLGHEIMVRHRRHRQLQPRPFAHLPRIGAACVDHMLAGDRALLGLDLPLAAWQLGDVRRAAAADDPDALGPRARGHRHGDVGGVHVPVVGRVQRADHAVQIVERMQLGNALRPHQLDVELQGPSYR